MFEVGHATDHDLERLHFPEAFSFLVPVLFRFPTRLLAYSVTAWQSKDQLWRLRAPSDTLSDTLNFNSSLLILFYFDEKIPSHERQCSSSQNLWKKREEDMKREWVPSPATVYHFTDVTAISNFPLHCQVHPYLPGREITSPIFFLWMHKLFAHTAGNSFQCNLNNKLDWKEEISLPYDPRLSFSRQGGCSVIEPADSRGRLFSCV